MPSTGPLRQACENCRGRKVKCIGKGTNQCRTCAIAGFPCTYSAIPRNKRRNRQGQFTSELLETKHQAQLAAGFPTDPGFDSRSLPSTFAPTPGLLPRVLVDSCIDYFFSHVYPLEPVLHRQQAKEAVDGMDCSIEAYCMIAALCAYVMIQADHIPLVSVLSQLEMAHLSAFDIGRTLLKESVRVRQGYDYRKELSYMSVLTSWFYSGCFIGLAQEDTAWSYLSEATSQARLLDMHDNETYKGDPLDASHMRMLYLVLFIAERTYALHHGRPISLYVNIDTPSMGEILSDRPIAFQFEVLMNMFKIIDKKFMNAWNFVQGDCTDFSWIPELHSQLTRAVPKDLVCTKGQWIEVHITKVWLHLKIWKLDHARYPLEERQSFYESLILPSHKKEIASSFYSILSLLREQDVATLSKGLTVQLCDIAHHLPSTQNLDLNFALLDNLLLLEFEKRLRLLMSAGTCP